MDMGGRCPPSPSSLFCSQWESERDGKNAHWADYRVLKRCLVKRWEDITKLETCLHSLWTKRMNLQETLVGSEGQLVAIERSLPLLATVIDKLNTDIEKAENCWKELQKEREGDVDTILAAARRQSSSSSPCACRRFNASLSSDCRKNLRSLMSPVGNLKCQQDEVRRKIDMMRADLQCKLKEQRNLQNRRDHLKNVVEQVTRNLHNVGEEVEKINTRWKDFRCEVERMETKMKEQWGRSALDRLTPANVSRCRFF